MAEGQWYYCLTHHAVEPYDGCKSIDRLGPYETPEDAACALAKVAERNEAWENDPRFNDDEPGPFPGEDEADLNPFTP
jgi:hypothetical protein